MEKLQLPLSTDEDIKESKANIDHSQSRFNSELNKTFDMNIMNRDIWQDNDQEIPAMKKSRSLELLSLHHYHFSYSNPKENKSSSSKTTAKLSSSGMPLTKKCVTSSPLPGQTEFKSSVRSLTQSPSQLDSDGQYHHDATLPPLIKKHLEEQPTLEWESEIDYNDSTAINSSLYYLPSHKYDENTTSNDNIDTDSAVCDTHTAYNSSTSLTDLNLQFSKPDTYHTDNPINDILDKTQTSSSQIINGATDNNTQSNDNIISSNLIKCYSGTDVNLQSSYPPSLDSQLEAISLNGSMKGTKINHIRFNKKNDNVKLYQSLTNSSEKISKNYYQDPIFVVHDWQEYHNQVAKYFRRYRQSSFDQFDHIQHDTASIKTA